MLSAIRAATIEDAGAIAQVHVVSWQQAYRDLLSPEFLAGLSVATRQSMWAESLARGRTSLLVAEANGRVVGFSAFGPSRDEAAGPTDHELWALYLAPSHWSTGLGRRLWLASLEILVWRGATDIGAWVLEGNERAIRFYAAAGFRPESGAVKVCELGGAAVREVRYVWRREAGL